MAWNFMKVRKWEGAAVPDTVAAAVVIGGLLDATAFEEGVTRVQIQNKSAAILYLWSGHAAATAAAAQTAARASNIREWLQVPENQIVIFDWDVVNLDKLCCCNTSGSATEALVIQEGMVH